MLHRRANAHWHYQKSTLASADQRRLAGVVGNQRNPVLAELHWSEQDDSVGLMIKGARIRSLKPQHHDVLGLSCLMPEPVRHDDPDDDFLFVQNLHKMQPATLSARSRCGCFSPSLDVAILCDGVHR